MLKKGSGLGAIIGIIFCTSTFILPYKAYAEEIKANNTKKLSITANEKSTLSQTEYTEDGWKLINGDWYYIKNGEILKNNG